MGARVPQAAPLGDAFFPAASATDIFIAAEAGRMTSRFGESPVPKYGGLMAFPKKD